MKIDKEQKRRILTRIDNLIGLKKQQLKNGWVISAENTEKTIKALEKWL